MDGNPASATAQIVMPGQFEIVSHDTSYTHSIDVGSDLTVIWSSSNNANAYLCHFHLSYHYIDTLGFENNFWFYQDTLVADTSLFYSYLRLFPDIVEIDSILAYSYGSFSVESISGPCLVNDVANVQGDAIGFFNGRVLGGYFALWVRNTAGGLAILQIGGEKARSRSNEF